jgi:hypothetical protein
MNRLAAKRRHVKLQANPALITKETKMLSPHEFATLMLLKDAPLRTGSTWTARMSKPFSNANSSHWESPRPGSDGLFSPSTVTRFSRLLRESGE